MTIAGVGTATDRAASTPIGKLKKHI